MEKINERYRNDTMMTNVLFYKVTVINQVSWGTVVKSRYNQIVSFMKCASNNK